MKFTEKILLLVVLAAVPWPLLGQTDTPQPATSKTEPVPEFTYQVVNFLPGYRFASSSGFAGRAAEYDSLFQSVGGDLAFTRLDYGLHSALKYRASFTTRDEYDMDTQFKLGRDFSFSMSNRSFLRHLDDVSFGTNLDPDATIRTNFIPDSSLFGVKRTMNKASARYKVPHTPLTVFAIGGWQARRGLSQLQFFDMGTQNNPYIPPPDPNSCGGGSCHSTSRYRPINYTTRNVGGGVEMKLAHVAVTFEHEYRSFNYRLQNPVDYYGTAASVDGEGLPPLGPAANSPLVPDTPQGYYAHNVLPRHDSQVDLVRMHAPVFRTLTFNGSLSYSRTENLFTGNPQNGLNGDATLNWNPTKKLHSTLDFHQQNLLNDFIPTLYTLFGNPSMHRHWTNVSLEYNLTPMFDVETHYRRTGITRSNADLWPQFYSLSSVGLVGTEADAFVPRLVASTFSNTAGFALKFHRSQTWNLRSGYEWIGTHAPGYLTDPQTSHRVFAGGSFTPKSWISVSEDFSVLRQSDFVSIQRQNRLYLSTSQITLRPVSEWSLGMGYAYYHNNLKSDMMFGTDPFYSQSLVPFKAISQSYSVSSTYTAKKKLAFNVELAHVSSSSSLRPDLTNAPDCTAGPTQSCAVSLAFASQFSTVSVPQALASSTVDYRWRAGFDSGLRFQYGSYKDEIHPELTGHFGSYGVFLGRTW